MKKILMLLLLFATPGLHAQQGTDSIVPFRYGGTLYLEFGGGLDFSTYRDFATSPLRYFGPVYELPLSIISTKEKREIRFTFRNSIGAYTILSLDELTTATGYVNNLRYSHLFRIGKWSSDKWNIKAGGTYDLTTIFRLNASLMNNATGYELFGSLMGSMKVTRDLSRRTARDVTILWVPIHLKQRRRELSFQADISLINSTFRNGFAYIGQQIVINNLVIFDDYQFKLASGFRMSSQLDYTHYLRNNNALRVAYIWDAYTTGGDLPTYEMSHHIFQFSFLFNFK